MELLDGRSVAVPLSPHLNAGSVRVLIITSMNTVYEYIRIYLRILKAFDRTLLLHFSTLHGPITRYYLFMYQKWRIRVL